MRATRAIVSAVAAAGALTTALPSDAAPLGETIHCAGTMNESVDQYGYINGSGFLTCAVAENGTTAAPVVATVWATEFSSSCLTPTRSFTFTIGGHRYQLAYFGPSAGAEAEVLPLVIAWKDSAGYGVLAGTPMAGTAEVATAYAGTGLCSRNVVTAPAAVRFDAVVPVF